MKITITFPPCGTDIPYFDPDECDPNERHEYVDLRSQPDVIDDLPEITAVPVLKGLLLKINGPNTIFRTFGCNFYFSPGETTEIGPPIAPSTEPQTQTTADIANSYLHVGFADIDRCTSLDDYYRLIGRLAKSLHENAAFDDDEGGNSNFHVELGIESLRMDGDDKGHVLSITCDTIGWTEEEAKSAGRH